MSKEYAKDIKTISAAPSPADIILAEDFEGTFNWFLDDSGGLFTRKDPKAAFLGDYGLRMKTREVGALATDYVKASKLFGALRNEVLEISFRQFNNAANFAGIIEMIFYYYTPTKETVCGLKFDYSTDKWYYLESPGIWKEITGITHTLYWLTWALIKLVVNPTLERYVLLDLQTEKVLLGDIPIYTAANPDKRMGCYFELYVRNTQALYSDMFFDQIFIRADPMT